MSRAVLLVLSLVALALPAAAAAKGPGGIEGGVTVCGEAGCATTAANDPTDLGAYLAGDKTRPPSSGAPFYQVTLPMRTPVANGEGPLWEVLYVPSLGVVRSTGGDGRPIWLSLPPASRAAYDRVVRGQAPMPPSALPGVRRPAPAPGGDGGVPAWLIALAGAGALAAVALAARRRRRPRLLPTTLLALALVLAAAGPAGAKELASVKVCGEQGCRTTSAKGQDGRFLDGGAITSPPTGRAPFYRVTFRMAIPESASADEPTWTVLYVPSKGVIRSPDDGRGTAQWLEMRPDQRAAYATAARGLEPLPADALPGVRAPATAPSSDGGVAGWLIGLAAAVAVAAAALAATVVRRRTGTPPPRAV